jgi:hypothetical protein
VLGVAGLPDAPRHWAHDDVAEAMAERCPGCVDRLRQRLGAAAPDLGDAPAQAIRVPSHRVIGRSGRLGPWDWWRLARADAQPVTVWRLGRARLWWSPGLLNGDGPFDARDTELRRLVDALAQLEALAARDGRQAVHVGDQGPVRGADWPALSLRYGRGLMATVRERIDAGGAETDPPGRWPGLAPDWSGHPWHGLNWQRAWRQIEPELLGERR